MEFLDLLGPLRVLLLGLHLDFQFHWHFSCQEYDIMHSVEYCSIKAKVKAVMDRRHYSVMWVMSMERTLYSLFSPPGAECITSSPQVYDTIQSVVQSTHSLNKFVNPTCESSSWLCRSVCHPISSLHKLLSQRIVCRAVSSGPLIQ